MWASSPQGERHSKTTLALTCANGFSYSSPRFLHPATCELRGNAEVKRESGWKFTLGFQSFQVALHFSATVQDATSLLQGSVKGQRAPNGHLYFGEPTQSPLRLGKEGTMGPGQIVLVIPEFSLQNSHKNSGCGATHVLSQYQGGRDRRIAGVCWPA